MTKKITTLIFLTVVNICFSQTLDRKTISQKGKIDRSLEPEMRGIELDNIIYYIEDDLQTLTAYENGKPKWKSNIIKFTENQKVDDLKSELSNLITLP